jgi:hypothetical protein
MVPGPPRRASSPAAGPGGRPRYDSGVISPEIGKILLVVGLLIAGIGLLAVLGVRLPLGNLPGDIRIEGERGAIVIPLATMIVISIVLTVLLNLLLRR